MDRPQALADSPVDADSSPSYPAFHSSGRVETPDGSWISFGIVGQRPPVILLHGLMSAAHSHAELAKILARRFTMILPEVTANPGEPARRAFEAMMKMGKIDIAAIEAAAGGAL